MVDIRKIYRELEELCTEREFELDKEDVGTTTIDNLFPDIVDILDKLNKGLDEMEREVKNIKTKSEELTNSLDEVIDSIY
jgi:hypothetical protein